MRNGNYAFYGRLLLNKIINNYNQVDNDFFKNKTNMKRLRNITYNDLAGIIVALIFIIHGIYFIITRKTLESEFWDKDHSFYETLTIAINYGVVGMFTLFGIIALLVKVDWNKKVFKSK